MTHSAHVDAWRQNLAVQFRYLPRWVATKIQRTRWGEAVEFEDLEGAGMLGLVRGCERFDPDHKVKPITYLTTCVTNAIKTHVRSYGSLIRVPAHHYDHGDMLGDRTEDSFRARAVVSLNAVMRSGEEFLPSVAVVEDTVSVPAEMQDDWQAIQGAMGCLKPRDRLIVELRFLKQWSLSEIGRYVGISKERARQVVELSLERTRFAMRVAKAM